MTREQITRRRETALTAGMLSFAAIAVLLAVCLALAGKAIDNLQETNALLRAEIQAVAERNAEGVKLIPEAVVVAQAPAVEPVASADEPEWNAVNGCTITAYCPCSRCCGKWADGITASGVTAQQGVTVAVDPRVIPLGSEVRIEGDDTVYVAQDTGVSGRHVDVYYDSHSDALQWGSAVSQRLLEVRKMKHPTGDACPYHITIVKGEECCGVSCGLAPWRRKGSPPPSRNVPVCNACETCGWFPPVEEARKKKLRERG